MIPGLIISLITFPGVIAHEFAHELFCKLTGTRVAEICYFRLGNPSGYVVHEAASTVWKQILIGIGPLIVNTVIGFSIGLFASRSFLHEGRFEMLGMFLVWLGVSIAMHSFPSTCDAKSIWSAVWHKEAPIMARFAGTPLVAIIFLGAIGSVVWLDFAYGVTVVWALPKMILG